MPTTRTRYLAKIALFIAVLCADKLQAAATSSASAKLWNAYQKAEVFQKNGDFIQAARQYEQAVALAPQVYGAEDPRTANLLNNLAIVSERVGKYAEAESLYRRSITIWQTKLGSDDLKVASGLTSLGTLYQRTGRAEQAEPLFQRALATRERKWGRSHPDVAESLQALGSLYMVLGQHDRAELLLRRSLAICRGKLAADDPAVARSEHTLATCYTQTGRYAEALPLFQKSLNTWEAKFGPNHPDTGYGVMDLGELHEALGDLSEAQKYFARGLKIWQAKFGPEHASTGYALHDLATLHAARGDHAQAVRLFQRSLRIYEKTFVSAHPDIADSLSHLARSYEALDQGSEAAGATDRARRIQARHIMQVLPVLSEPEQLLFLQNRYQPPFHQALSLALAHHADAAVVAQSAGWVLNGKAITHQVLAERLLLARENNNPAVARALQELTAVRAQLATLSFAGTAANKSQQQQLADREERLAKQVSRAGVRHGTAWVELAAVRDALPADAVLIEVAKFERWNFQARGSEEPWAAPHYAAWVIPPADKGSVVLVDLGEARRIDQNVQQVRKVFEHTVESITADGEPSSEREARQVLGQLAKLVLQPLLQHVTGAEQWIISADGDLWLVPWSALPLDNQLYAVEKHTISYVVSGRDLLDRRAQVRRNPPVIMANPKFDLLPSQARTRSQRLLASSGNVRGMRAVSPDIKLPRVQELPGTAVEAMAIKEGLQKYAGAEPEIYLGEDALESVFKSRHGPSVVVLSTHGFFLEDPALPAGTADGSAVSRLGKKRARPMTNPLLRCGLLLAGVNERARARNPLDEDGVLTGLEIVGTDLRGTELVVLSACETALGRVEIGEGVAGLRQAFHLAGARAVLGTLWQIHDQETARLMGGFFNHLATGAEKRDALRQAQCEFIQARRARHGAAHPYFWAAFTLTGI